MSLREPFGGIYYGILDVEGDDPSPPMLFADKAEADAELARRQALPDDDDAWLSEYHHVLPCHIAGALWNSFDPDPRANVPLDADEIATVHKGKA